MLLKAYTDRIMRNKNIVQLIVGQGSEKKSKMRNAIRGYVFCDIYNVYS